MIKLESPTHLDDRMRAHTGGQITWPEPKLGKYCDACRHFDQADTSAARMANGWGRCSLVEKHHATIGVQFKGQEATACPHFSTEEKT